MTIRSPMAIAGIAAAVAVGGCGDDGGPAPATSIETVPTTAGRPQAPERREARTKRKSDTRRKGAAQSPPGSSNSFERRIKQGAARLPKSKRAAAVNQVTRAVVGRFGLTVQDVDVASSGNDVRVAIASASACGATRDTESNLAGFLRKAVPWLRTIRVTVGGQALSQYLGGHCRPLELPGGSGRVLLFQKGVGFKETGTFTVTSKRWTIEYINGGSLLQVLLMKGSFPTGQTFRSVKRRAGRQVVRGAGTFSLQVAGTGEWVVRVRDSG